MGLFWQTGDALTNHLDMVTWSLLPFPPQANPVNPYTTMRQNIEAAMESSAALMALGFTIRKWEDPFENIADMPAADRGRWLRVESESIEEEPDWTNTHAETVHTLRIVASLGVHGGMRQADIEEAWWQIQNVLLPMTRNHALFDQAVPSVETVDFAGGPVAVGETRQERQHGTSNLAWATVATVRVVYHQSVESAGWETPAPDDDFSTTQPTNPYSRMRRNVEHVLANSAFLQELGFALRAWNDRFKNIADAPAGDRRKWMRVETEELSDDTYFANGVVETTQALRLVAALSFHGGLRAADIEDAWWGIQRTLGPLSRVLRSKLNEDVAQVTRIRFEGGDLAVATDEQERQHATENLAWGHVGRVRVTMLHRMSDLVA